MDDAGAVRRGDRIGDLSQELEPSLERQAAAGEGLPEGDAFDLLHRDEVHALLLADVVDRDQVGMIECRRRSRLAGEPRNPLRIRDRVGSENLEGDVPAERGVDRVVHVSHPAAAEQQQDLVATDRPSGQIG